MFSKFLLYGLHHIYQFKNNVDSLDFKAYDIERFVTHFLVNQHKSEKEMYSLKWINNILNALREMYINCLERKQDKIMS